MKLAILMYHKIDELRDGVRFPGNYVSPAAFAEQMDALTAAGYRTIELDAWLRYRTGRLASLPRRPLVVSFDDGYTCFERNAWPVLRARSMSAIVFLVAGQIGGFNAWDPDELREPLLDAASIRALRDEGVHFGSHSVTHPALAKLEPHRALDELSRSRSMLTELLGNDVDTFAYPFSNQSREVRKLSRQAGYRCAVRGKGRMNWRFTDPFALRRIKVEPGTTGDALERALWKERHFGFG